MGQRPARRLLIGYLTVLAALTLVPVVGPWVTDTLVHLARELGSPGGARTVELVDNLTNTALFVPAGLLVSAALPRSRPLLAWLVCAGASALVEVAQAIAVPGREASLTDVATNALGAAVGVLLQAALAGSRRARRARRSSAGQRS